MLEASSLPQSVTRFYGNLDYALDVIEKGQIAFVHISQLNDPFDPYLFFESEFHKNRQEFIKYLKKFYPERERWFRKWISPEGFQRGFKVVKDNLNARRKTTFMLSTCAENRGNAPRDNLYMWGHYASGHRGIAIEFDTLALTHSVIAHASGFGYKQLSPGEIWVGVQYKAAFQPLTGQDYLDFLIYGEQTQAGSDEPKAPPSLERYLDLMLRLKSNVWKPENEWRLLWTSDEIGPVYKCPINSSSIKTVIFGLRLSEQYRKDLRALLRHNFPTAKVLVAQKRYGDFALEFD